MDVCLLRHDLHKVADRVTEAETRVSTAKDEIATQVTQLQRVTAFLEDRAEDSENRSCRNNLRMVGVPEGVDTPDILVEEWFQSWVTSGTLSMNFSVERAHRSLVAYLPLVCPLDRLLPVSLTSATET